MQSEVQKQDRGGKKILMLASVASMIVQFNMANIQLLLNMGYEVHVACNFKEGNTCPSKQVHTLLQTLQSQKVICHQWDCPRGIHAVGKCVRAYCQLWKLTGTYQFAWLHCHSPIGGALARIVAHKRGMRVIYTAHGFHFYRGAPLLNWLLYYPAEAFLAHWTDVLVTVNREDFCFAKRRMRAKKIFYIPGIGIDTERFAKEHTDSQKAKAREHFCKKYRIPFHASVLLSVGELNKGKNHRIVIKALAALKRPDVYYIICGQGPLRGWLSRYAGRLGVKRHIRMPGYQEQMPWICGNADIFVFPSKREGMPVALMEAMAAGLPCVVSNIRGNRELIHDAAGGMRFRLGQGRQLIKALAILLDDTRLRQACGRYNQKRVKHYDQSVVEKRMYEIYMYLSMQS